jgi:hypothetical protein
VPPEVVLILSAEVATRDGRLLVVFEPVMDGDQVGSIGAIGDAMATAGAISRRPDKVRNKGEPGKLWPVSTDWARTLVVVEGLQQAILDAAVPVEVTP